MKKKFQKPSWEVISFANGIISTSGGCGCDVGGIDFGEGANAQCEGGNNPTCTCSADTEVNCA